MKKTIFITLISLISFITQAQRMDDVYTFPTPEAASLGLVGSIPVDLYSGRTSISIPLFNPDYFGYQVPVNLSYNSEGFKPNVQNSWVGQGWSLQAGGVITRVVKGAPDESEPFGLLHSYDKFMDYKNNEAYYTSAERQGAVDTEPDEFHFSVNGLSGVFYLNEDREFVVMSNPGIKVEYSKSDMVSEFSVTGRYTDRTFKGFIITDQTGNKYYFGKYRKGDDNIEVSVVADSEGGSAKKGIATSWHLSYISLKRNDQNIYFNYSPKKVNVSKSYMEKARQLVDLGGGEPQCNITIPRSVVMVNYMDHIYLESIECPAWKINFHTSDVNYTSHPGDRYYTPNGLTGPNWQKLDSVTLKNNMSEEGIKSVKFNYKEKNPVRLFLASVQETGKPPYEFDYYNYESTLRVKFDDNSLDHWGFYNGDIWPGNSGYLFRLIPNPLPVKYFSQFGSMYYPRREVDFNSALMGTLSKIKHPTGGTTEFEYEPSTYSWYMYYDGGSANNTVYPLEIKQRWGEAKSFYHNLQPNDNQTSVTFSNPAYIKLYIDAPYASHLQQKDTFYMVDKGTHPLRTFINSSWPEDTYYSISINYTEIILSDYGIGGGLRIKEIRQKDGASEIIKEYNYQRNYIDNPTDTTSSGYLAAYPFYGCSYNARDGSLQVEGVKRASTSNSLDYANGRQIGYSTVTEITKNSAGNILGYTEYKYSNFDVFPDIAPVPMAQMFVNNDFYCRTRRDFCRGKLLRQNVYDANKKLLETTSYTYGEFEHNPQVLKGIAMNSRITDFNPCITLGRYSYNMCEYTIFNNTFLPVSMEKKEYTNDDVITLKTEYIYNEYDLIKEETTHTDNIIKDSYTYNFEYTTSPFRGMVQNNILSRVVEKTTTSDNKVISSIRTDYYGSENLFLPRKVQHSTNKVNYYDVRTYNEYDYDGQVIQYTDKDNIPNVIIWSYSYQYPTFEIKNITLEQLEAAIGHPLYNEMYGDVYINDSRMVEIANELREKLPDHLITTAVYKPLVGMKSITDARGITTYHDYDEAGRLKESYIIEDGEKKILQAYDYHYKN